MVYRQMFAALVREAERRVSEFTLQGLANMAWAFTSDERLLTMFAGQAERRDGASHVMAVPGTGKHHAETTLSADRCKDW